MDLEGFNVREAIHAFYSVPRSSYPFGGKLYVSSFGRCIRTAFGQMLELPSGEFPAHLREVMDLGTAYEDQTLKALQRVWAGQVTTQTRLKSDVWSGKLDFLVMRPDDVPLIIEHKATGDKWWDYKANLPKFDHVAQLWLYGQLWFDKYGELPRLDLVYRAWGHIAQFQVIQEDRDYLLYSGEIDGKPVNRALRYDFYGRRERFEEAFNTFLRNGQDRGGGADPDADMAYWRSLEVECSEEQGCLFQGRPSCGMYGACWNED